MRRLRYTVFVPAALALTASAALAQVKGVSTTFNGSSSGSGTFSRTIIDVTDPPPGPGGRGAFQTQSTHVVTVSVPPGKTNKQIAVAVRDSLNLQVGSFGYTAVFPDVDTTRVVLTKPGGTFTQSGETNGIPGSTNTNVFLVPALSGTGMGALATSMLALLLVWRRRRVRA